MWYGKLCVICFVFSIAILFSTYYINQVFNDPVITQSTTYQSLGAIMASFNPNISPNPTLIFGDFISAFNLLKDLIAGGVFSTVFGHPSATTSGDMGLLGNSGYYDASLQIFMGLLFDSATLFFILYIVSNRSI